MADPCRRSSTAVRGPKHPKRERKPVNSVSVAAVAVDDDRRVLAIRRRDNGEWEPPGGCLEPGEPSERGLVREVLEETGVIVRPLALTGIYEHVERGIEALVYRCRVAGGDLQRSTEEATAVRWMTADEVDREMRPVFAVRVYDALDEPSAVPRPRRRRHDGRILLPASA